ncbi:MAG: hypothetical protein ACRD5W_04280 [Candidatus Acidiferrales bacterium]
MRHDGEQIHAQLLGAYEDKDGGRYIVFDVLWSTRPEFDEAHRGCAFELSLTDISDVEPRPREKGNEYLNAQSDLRT